MIVLIDADSIIYILSYIYREETDASVIKKACDSFFFDICDFTSAQQYLGSFSCNRVSNFRYERYKFAEYKGTRKDSPDYVLKWRPVIVDYFVDKYKFIVPDTIEADDVISLNAVDLLEKNIPFVIASPDKDLRQIPGTHYDYRAKTNPEEKLPILSVVEEETASINFWTQMLTGDTTDNVKGVPGIGEVKAKLILSEALKSGFPAPTLDITFRETVRNVYLKHFGNYYGDIIFSETFDTLKLLTPSHTFYKFRDISLYVYEKVPANNGISSIFESLNS